MCIHPVVVLIIQLEKYKHAKEHNTKLRQTKLLSTCIITLTFGLQQQKDEGNWPVLIQLYY